MNKEIIKDAVHHYGKEMQLNICIEELSELIKELCKDKRKIGNADHIAEEMADVCIIFNQLLEIYQNKKEVNEWIAKKTFRLQQRIEAEKMTKTNCRCSIKYDLFRGSTPKMMTFVCSHKYSDIDACGVCKRKKKLCRYFCRYRNKKYHELVKERKKE